MTVALPATVSVALPSTVARRTPVCRGFMRTVVVPKGMTVRTDLLAIGSLAGGTLLCSSATVVGVALGLPALAVGVCLLVVAVVDRARRYAGHTESGGVS
jgi:hypothetical protein